MSQNRVVIFSNGIAGFQRNFPVKAGTKETISIPVRQEHLADILASMLIDGNVRLTKPPSYSPSNELAGNLTLSASQVFEDLAKTLSGAAIRLTHAGKSIDGTLMGLHAEPESNGGAAFQPKSIVILSNGGVKRIPLREIEAWVFTDDAVQTEINKSLQRNLQSIKPNSTFVELEVEAENDSEVIVQYTIPSAVWKISYRIVLGEDDSLEILGFAIVDNNTDEDWKQFHVSVVTGEPITFSTDLAETKIPSRSHVDLVRDSAIGAVMLAGAGGMGGAAAEPFDSVMAAPEMDRSSIRKKLGRVRAAMPEAVALEVGDYCVFESKDAVDIPANRSAIIPVFQSQDGESKLVLVFKRKEHPVHPFRAIDFKNQTGFNLEKGVCTVFNQGMYAGSCVVPNLKKNEPRLLPYSLESGVVFEVIEAEPVFSQYRIRISDGRCFYQSGVKTKTTFHFRSLLDQKQDLVIEYDFDDVESNIDASLLFSDGTSTKFTIEKTAFSRRFRFSIPALAQGQLIVTNSLFNERIETIQFTVRGHRYDSPQNLLQLIKNDELTFHSDPQVKEILEVNQLLAESVEELTEHDAAKTRLLERQERLRKNLESAGQDEISARWRRELDESEQEVRQLLETEGPKLKQKRKELEKRLTKLIEALAMEWVAENAAEFKGSNDES